MNHDAGAITRVASAPRGLGGAALALTGDAPLLAHAQPHDRVATRAGQPIRADRFVGDVVALAARLPAADYVLNICHDRYAFAVTFCAALAAGRINLLPPSRTPEALAQLAARYPSLAVVGDGQRDAPHPDTLPPPVEALSEIPTPAVWPPPRIARAQVAAVAFTSGSTGEPQPQPKRWGGVVDGARAEIDALGLAPASAELVLVGTVSAQHMYGLESTVILALHGPCAFAAEHPLHPHEVIDVLARQPARRVLVTTPVHLRALSEARDTVPPLACVVSATAPLADELAARCERAWQAPVREVYGCTETGMVATRRTVAGPVWQALRDVRITPHGEVFWASGGHVVQPGPLMDRLRLHSEREFELLGRADDLINIAGKRASLAGLNRVLLEIPGVVDGVLFLPEPTAAEREPRLTALVVAPALSVVDLRAALRARMDPVFLPRPLLKVPALPRNAQGKLPRAQLLALAAAHRRPTSP